MSSKVVGVFPKLYSFANQAGLFHVPGARLAYGWAYFAYKKHFEDPFNAFCRRYPEMMRNGHVLDVGANVGYTAWVFSAALARAGSDSRVFAFEPETENFARLSRLAKGRACRGRVEPVRAAIGDQKGELELWINEDHNADHRVLTSAFRSSYGVGKSEKVPVVTLDSFCQERKIDRDIAFVKIDVQGYEPAVSRGMVGLLDSNPDLRVAIEVDPGLMRTLGEDGSQMNRIFSERGFRFAWIRRDGSLSPIRSIEEDEVRRVVGSEKGYLDVLCSRGKEIS